MNALKAGLHIVVTVAENASDDAPKRILRLSPGGVMTLHDYGYLPPEFLESYPVSE